MSRDSKERFLEKAKELILIGHVETIAAKLHSIYLDGYGDRMIEEQDENARRKISRKTR